MYKLPTIRWENGKVILIDQTRLPLEYRELECSNYLDMADAIKKLKVRGAPAIGVAAAYGIVLGAMAIKTDNKEEFIKKVYDIAEEIKSTRPTAVNLFWAVNRMLNKLNMNRDKNIDDIKKLLLDEAQKMAQEDVETNRMIAENGKDLIKDGFSILTHCNTGALATVDIGTALGIIVAAHKEGKKIHVFVDETRPLLQGARLTAWELNREGISMTLITDNMAAFFMSKKKVDMVIVGADRIALNGDTANKIGTYGLAVLAKYHNIPFYVAAPLSTVDFGIKSGQEIPIEERNPEEVTNIAGIRVAPEGVKVSNPAFDVTPGELITAIITEKGIAYPPYCQSLLKLKSKI